jgi:hypothetical protein
MHDDLAHDFVVSDLVASTIVAFSLFAFTFAAFTFAAFTFADTASNRASALARCPRGPAHGVVAVEPSRPILGLL